MKSFFVTSSTGFSLWPLVLASSKVQRLNFLPQGSDLIPYVWFYVSCSNSAGMALGESAQCPGAAQRFGLLFAVDGMGDRFFLLVFLAAALVGGPIWRN
jgi:hypothetical protein